MTPTARDLAGDPPFIDAARDRNCDELFVWSKGQYGSCPSRSVVRAAKRLLKVAKVTGAVPKSAESPPVEKQGYREVNGERTYEEVRSDIHTLEEFIAAHEIDTDVWDIYDQEIKTVSGTWDSLYKNNDNVGVVTELKKGSTSFKVKMRRRQEVVDVTAIIDAAILRMDAHSPSYPRLVLPRAKEALFCNELCIFDPHIGKLCWATETGGAHYDTKIAQRLIENAAAGLVAMSDGFNTDRFLLPIGNDFFNVDNEARTTTGGTPQDEDGRWQHTFNVGVEASVNVIESLLSIAPVDVIIVPGNHDRTRVYYLGCVLQAFFRRCNGVTIKNDPGTRHYYKYGNTLLGFTHGFMEKKDSLHNLMSREAKQDWHDTTHHEWHLGHLHKRKTTSYGPVDTEDEENGVRVRIMPSLAPPDAWHASKGFISQRAAVSLLHHKTKGPMAEFKWYPESNKVH